MDSALNWIEFSSCSFHRENTKNWEKKCSNIQREYYDLLNANEFISIEV